LAKTPQLSVISNADDNTGRLSRAEAAARLGVSVATVRRYEGTLLHATVDDAGAHWFSPKEVTALAASRANQAIDRGSIRNAKPVPEARTRGEIAARVFDRYGLRVAEAAEIDSLDRQSTR